MEGDGYYGDRTPLTPNEVFTGLTAQRARQVDCWAVTSVIEFILSVLIALVYTSCTTTDQANTEIVTIGNIFYVTTILVSLRRQFPQNGKLYLILNVFLTIFLSFIG